VCVAVTAIGLEIGALGPFVPRIEEHEPFTGDGMPAGVIDRQVQPLAIPARRAVGERVAGAGLARLVVPGRKHPADHVVIGNSLFSRALNDLTVLDDIALIGRIDDLELVVDRLETPSQFVRGKFYGCVEAVNSRILDIELDHCKEQFANADCTAVRPPAFERRLRIRKDRRPVQDNDWPPIDTDIAWVAQRGSSDAMKARSSSAEWFWPIKISWSKPSQRRVQFSLAQHTQNGKSMSLSARNCCNGLSIRRLPPNQ